MSTKTMSSAQFIVFQVFWNTILPQGPPKNQLRRRGAFLGFSTLFWKAHRCRLRTLSVKFLDMSYFTSASLPSAGLYCDFTSPLVHNFVRFWIKQCVQFVTPALLQQHSVSLLQTTLLGISLVIHIVLPFLILFCDTVG